MGDRTWICPECGSENYPGEVCPCANEPALRGPGGRFIIDFARAHGLTIAEACEHPMVKQRNDYHYGSRKNPEEVP